MEEEIITIEEDGEEVVVTLEEDILYCNDYDLLKNLPTINTIEVKGDKTGADYGLVDAEVGKGLSANDFTDDFETKLTGIEAGAEVNNISDTNATDLTDGGATTLHKHSYNNLDDKPTIPSITGLAELTDDSTHRLTTDTEKTTWNAKVDTTQLNNAIPYYQTKTTLDATLVAGTIYELGTLTGNISFALPSGTTRQKCMVKFDCGSTPYTFTITGTNYTTFSLTPLARTNYEVEFEYNAVKSKWIPSTFSCLL